MNAVWRWLAKYKTLATWKIGKEADRCKKLLFTVRCDRGDRNSSERKRLYPTFLSGQEVVYGYRLRNIEKKIVKQENGVGGVIVAKSRSALLWAPRGDQQGDRRGKQICTTVPSIGFSAGWSAGKKVWLTGKSEGAWRQNIGRLRNWVRTLSEENNFPFNRDTNCHLNGKFRVWFLVSTIQLAPCV